MTTAISLPDIQPPAGAHEVTEWVDVGTPDLHRTFSGPRREAKGNYVEAYGLQNPDGSLDELAVRADIDVWQHRFHQHWDNGLSPLEARRLADELDAAVGELSALASALRASANEVDGWAAR